MQGKIRSVIIGSGTYLPKKVVENSEFLNNVFFDRDGNRLQKTNEEIVTKFQEITEIARRRYVENGMLCSDMATEAAKKAIEISGIDPETLDYIIVGHNFGDIRPGNRRVDYMPTIAARVKHNLRIKNPYCVCNDVPFGCPGWVQGMIQADYFIRSGDAKRIMVIGSELLSRIVDPHDIDCMIFSDGAGAAILEAREGEDVGILAHLTRSDTLDEAFLLYMDESYNPEFPENALFAKMEGHKIYEYALTHVPQLVADTINKAGLTITDIQKVLIHQANAKMDDAILKRLFRIYGLREIPENIMPMTIAEYGNNSVATVPVLYDLIVRGKFPGHELHSGDNVVMASVGAGMNINAFVYCMP